MAKSLQRKLADAYDRIRALENAAHDIEAAKHPLRADILKLEKERAELIHSVTELGREVAELRITVRRMAQAFSTGKERV